MDTILNITHLIILFFGALFCGFLIYKAFILNKWRFFPKQYKKRIDYRKAESRLQAKKEGKKKFKYNGGKLIIWDQSMRNANRRFAAMTEKEKNSQTEIF